MLCKANLMEVEEGRLGDPGLKQLVSFLNNLQQAPSSDDLPGATGEAAGKIVGAIAIAGDIACPNGDNVSIGTGANALPLQSTT